MSVHTIDTWLSPAALALIPSEPAVSYEARIRARERYILALMFGIDMWLLRMRKVFHIKAPYQFCSLHTRGKRRELAA